ncbi:PAS domain S-box-containing protein [Syntrophus gentianae]|uniref:histidine kinase n=1 Tax=Syntrophus gentianae TaxID=43775 RepID=A0A1H7VPS7_9BACT|nr:ATP-binding protein [Syntrophus gentianae]SEM10788.1 PAS domain S-box-containing protein [Syntrophus gentianae]
MFGLRHKLSLGFGGLLLILLIIGVQGILRFQELGQSIDVILRENYNSIVACQQMKENLSSMDRGIMLTFLGYPQEGEEQIRKNEALFAEALQMELNNVTLPGEREKARALQALIIRYRAVLQEIRKRSLPDNVSRRLYLAELMPLSQQVKQSADEILQLNQQNMNAADSRARKLAASAQRQMVLLLSFGVFIAMIFLSFTGKWILHPIHRLTRSAEAIRDGNLELVVPAESRDEIGRLSEAFNDMAESLREFRRSDEARLLRMERATQEAFDHLPDALAILNPEGKVEISSAAARSLFGLMAGISLQDLPLDDLQTLFRETVSGAKSRQPETGHRIHQRFVDGDERFFRSDMAPIRDRRGNLSGMILMMQDITEQRRLSEMKRGMISTVSHQLKTPLTSVRMAVHLLLEEKIGPLTEKQEELLLAAREESDLLYRILTDLLDISRIGSGRLQMNCREEAPRTLILEALEPIRMAARDRGIEVVTELGDALPPVYADPVQIGQVFSNLLNNALRYTAPGGRIAISAAAEGEMVRFFVSDTGSGIPHQFLQRIFEQFFRVPDQPTEKGAGLGLAIAKEIVEAHGGNINVESREGQGTTFSFTLKKADSLGDQE